MLERSQNAAFFDVDNTLLKGSTLFFLGRGMYQRGFFSRKDISAFVLANLRFRLTGKENRKRADRCAPDRDLIGKFPADFPGSHLSCSVT